MSALAAVYVSELANGNVPSPESEEAVAYREWSREYEKSVLVREIVKESAIKVYGHDFYLLGTI